MIAAVVLVCAASLSHAQTTDLDAVLNKTTHQVTTYLDRISHVRCTENVEQEKLGPNGKKEFVATGTNDYFLLFHSEDESEFTLNESRMPVQSPNTPKKNMPLLLTNGFSTLFLIFHPYYRNSFQFTAEPPDTIDGVTFARVRFTYVAGKRTPAVLALRGREYPLALAGTVWIDPATGMIARIETALQDDMKDVGLRTLTSRVDYAPVKLQGWTEQYRFPVVATVEVETLKQHWLNIHKFSDYKRYGVGTRIDFKPEAD